MRKPLLIAVLSMALLGTACGPASDGGGAGDDTTVDTETLPAGAHQLVLRMDYSPGFARLPENAPLPAFSLYGDGRIVTADLAPDAPTRPGGWHRAARELRTGTAGVQRLVRAALAAGLLDAPATSSAPGKPVPDAPLARFLLLDKDGGRHSLTVVAPEAQGGARGELFRALSNPTDWLGGIPSAPYRPEALAVLRRDEPLPASGARRWPLGALTFPGTQVDGGLGVLVCTVLRGDPAARLTAKATDAPQSTQWTDGRRTATLELRPLLPDENDCRDLRNV